MISIQYIYVGWILLTSSLNSPSIIISSLLTAITILAFLLLFRYTQTIPILRSLSMYLCIYLSIYVFIFLVFCELKLFFPHISKRVVLLVIQFFSQISCLRRTLPEIQYLKQYTDLTLFTFGTMFIAKKYFNNFLFFCMSHEKINSMNIRT